MSTKQNYIIGEEELSVPTNFKESLEVSVKLVEQVEHLTSENKVKDQKINNLKNLLVKSIESFSESKSGKDLCDKEIYAIK